MDTPVVVGSSIDVNVSGVVVEKVPETTENKPVYVSTMGADGVSDIKDVVTTDNQTGEAEHKIDDATEWKNADSFTGASLLSTVINTINTVIGAAIISIAYSIRISGVWGAIVMVIVVLVPSLITSYYMSCATLYSNEDIYGKIGKRLVNNAVGILADISLVILDLGIDVAYMKVLFNQIEAIGKDVFNAGDFFTGNKTVSIFLIHSNSFRLLVLLLQSLFYSLSVLLRPWMP